MRNPMQHRLATIFFVLAIFTSKPSFAQAQQENLVDDSIRDITTVMLTGAGGAILGLSTLSFVDEPSDHLRNILVGGAIGIIIGVGVVAYNQANVSKEVYKSQALHPVKDIDFSTLARNDWHQTESERYSSLPKSMTSLSYSFNF